MTRAKPPRKARDGNLYDDEDGEPRCIHCILMSEQCRDCGDEEGETDVVKLLDEER